MKARKRKRQIRRRSVVTRYTQYKIYIVFHCRSLPDICIIMYIFFYSFSCISLNFFRRLNYFVQLSYWSCFWFVIRIRISSCHHLKQLVFIICSHTRSEGRLVCRSLYPVLHWDTSPSRGLPPAVCRRCHYTACWRETMWSKVYCERK